MDKLYGTYIFLVAFSKLLETYKQQDLCPFFGLAITTIVAFLVFFLSIYFVIPASVFDQNYLI